MEKKNRLDNLKPFKKGFDERRNLVGRPRTFINALREAGYKQSEISEAILVLCSMTLDELKQVFDNPAATVFEKTIANSLFTSLKKGSLYSLEILMNRSIGMPKQSTDVSMQMQFKVEAPNEHTKQLIEKL